MRIGEAAKLTGLSISNIRFYEKKGLLAPVRETESKYRDYSEEDIAQLKKIILYRKMNIPVETIYLLQNEEVSVASVLRRQEEELQIQKEMLQGSIDLCQKMLEADDLQNLDVDYYLNYVKEEEENGRQFAYVEELLEDIAEFSGISPFSKGGMKQIIFFDIKLRRAAALVLLAICTVVPVAEIAEGIRENGMFPTAKICFWAVWLLVLVIAFLRFRKGRGGRK